MPCIETHCVDAITSEPAIIASTPEKQITSIRRRQVRSRASTYRNSSHDSISFLTSPGIALTQASSPRDKNTFADHATYAAYLESETPTKYVGSQDGLKFFKNSESQQLKLLTVATSQFHNAAKRLALLSPSSTSKLNGPKRPFTPHGSRLQPTHISKTATSEISPARKTSQGGYDCQQVNKLNKPTSGKSPDLNFKPHRLAVSRPSKHDNSTLHGTTAQQPACPQERSHRKNFSRPIRDLKRSRSTPGSHTCAAQIAEGIRTPIPVVNITPAAVYNLSKQQSCTANAVTSTSSAASAVSSLPAGSLRTEKEARSLFDSAGSDSLGDKRTQLKHREIWLQRVIFALFVFLVNIGLGLAYLGSHKHPYLLAILVFIKSKDILSTLIDVSYLPYGRVHDYIWPPKTPTQQYILSLVCAYAETEEQIMKTVRSLAASTLQPHKQVICVILDGQPREVVANMTELKISTRRPYTTWRGNLGEIKIHGGSVDGTAIIVVEKVKNAGKKDSLILGHDLFNYPRGDMPHATMQLRTEIWDQVLPAIISDHDFKKIGYIFCTDADSTIHKYALQKLANALLREPNNIAACGVLFAELGTGGTEYHPWHLFQQFQYTFGQYIRRQAEGAWGRVTCLPGCITMIVVRPEMGDAVSQYARPVTDNNIFRHQVQYLGTDRRLTWCIMSQNKHLRTLFVPEALSETVTPNTLSHYLSQRRRWASNAYFNDLFYAFGPRQRLITRLFALIDIVRLTLVYYRVFNTAYFIHGLITKHFYITKIIPTLVVTKTPATWYLLLIIFCEPVLRRRIHKLFLGMLINQLVSPFLSVIIFTNVLFHMGSQSWGQTGLSTQGSAPSVTASEPQIQSPSRNWTPRRLARTVKNAIRAPKPAFRGNGGRVEVLTSTQIRTIPTKISMDSDTTSTSANENGATFLQVDNDSFTATTTGHHAIVHTPQPTRMSTDVTTTSLQRWTPIPRTSTVIRRSPIRNAPTKNLAKSNFDFAFGE